MWHRHNSTKRASAPWARSRTKRASAPAREHTMVVYDPPYMATHNGCRRHVVYMHERIVSMCHILFFANLGWCDDSNSQKTKTVCVYIYICIGVLNIIQPDRHCVVMWHTSKHEHDFEFLRIRIRRAGTIRKNSKSHHHTIQTHTHHNMYTT